MYILLKALKKGYDMEIERNNGMHEQKCKFQLRKFYTLTNVMYGI